MRICSVCQRCYDEPIASCTESGHPALSETFNGSTDMVPGYRLERRVSSGIKGDLFHARQVEFDRNCRISLFRPADATEQLIAQANCAASIIRPNVVEVYASGELETGECYVASEDPAGPSLRERLLISPAPDLMEAIVTVRRAAEVLEILHSKGLIHRAIRPDNIILAEAGSPGPTVRLQNVDFAGVIERSIISNKFLIDTAIDHVRYLAPEQCSGEPASARTDVYSLGIVLYEMLAGGPPFDAATAAAVIEKHKTERPPDIRIENFDLRMLVTHALTESLQKRPDRRQPSAAAFARQLRHIEQLASHVSTPPPAVVSPSVPVRRSVLNANQPIKVKAPVSPISDQTAFPARIISQSGEPEKSAGILVEHPLAQIDANRTSGAGTIRADEPNDLSSLSVPQPARTRAGIFTPEAAAAEFDREMAAVSRSRERPAKKIDWVTPVDDIPALEYVPAAIDDEVPLIILKPAIEAELSADTSMNDVAAASLPSAVEAEETVEPAPDVPPPPAKIDPPAPSIQARSPRPAARISEPRPPEVQPSAVAGPDPKREVPVRPSQDPASVRSGTARHPGPNDPNGVPAFKIRPRGIRISGLQNKRSPIRPDEPEVITLVSAAPSRFRVQLDKPKTNPNRTPARRVVPIPADESDFFPTLLGGAARPAVTKPAAETILADFYPETSASPLPYRTIAAAGGIVVLVAFVVFAASSLFKVNSNEIAGDSAAASSSSEPVHHSPAVAVVVAKPDKTDIEPAVAEAPAAPKAAEKPAARDEITSPPVQRVPATKIPESTAVRTAAPAKVSTKTSAPAPIIVGKTAAQPVKLIPERRPIIKANPIPVRSNGATRPRIVQVPR